jgi:hypothetical protein
LEVSEAPGLLRPWNQKPAALQDDLSRRASCVGLTQLYRAAGATQWKELAGNKSGREHHVYEQEISMADYKTKIGGQDRARVATDLDYDVRDFAEQFDISPAQAKRLIDRHGNDRGMLEREARRLKK